MPKTIFKGREAVTIENENLRVTVLVEGGHIAEVLEKRSGISPLWVPRWASIEPSLYTLCLCASPKFRRPLVSQLSIVGAGWRLGGS